MEYQFSTTTHRYVGPVTEFERFLELTGLRRTEVAAQMTTPEEPVPGHKEADVPGLESFMRNMLLRIPCSPGQLDLYRATYTAGDQGLSKDELLSRMGRTGQVMAGLLGTVGRRIHETPHSEEAAKALGVKIGIEVFFEITMLNGQWHYKMRPQLRRVLEELGLVER